MVCLVKHPAIREHMGKAGREKMKREFDERIVLEKTWEVYQQGGSK
jgi:hypothetical protein